jgi:hypothetical protein
MAYDPMREQLIRLTERLRKDNINLIVAGGYGLILKAEYLREKGIRTRFEVLPADRSTNDIDIFLSTEIITSAEKTEKVRDALQDLGFEPVANYFQFVVSVGEGPFDLKVKIDLLAPPVHEKDRKLVKIKRPRIRPAKAKDIHGFLTEEAVTVEEKLISVEIDEKTGSAEVFLPHPFSYLILKLFALRDRLEDEEKDFGAYHAFDIYRVIGMLVEEEWEECIKLREKYSDNPKFKEAVQIADELFGSIDSIGVARIRQHAKVNDTEIMDKYILGMTEDLAELFPGSLSTASME